MTILRDSVSITFWMKRSRVIEGAVTCVLSSNLRPAQVPANSGDATLAETVDADEDVCRGVCVFVDGLGRVEAKFGGVVVMPDDEAAHHATLGVSSEARAAEDEWWHVAVVFDGDDGRCRVYMNGDLDGCESPHLRVGKRGSASGPPSSRDAPPVGSATGGAPTTLNGRGPPNPVT